MAARYLPNLLITIELAALAMIVDLIFGFPFAYILVRKVRYREVVRAFMVFPMFGALYIAFGLRFILLPGGPARRCSRGAGHRRACPALQPARRSVFAMAIFTFPFMVMNVGTALSNVDPDLEEAAACLGARPWQTFRPRPHPADARRDHRGHADGLRLEPGRIRRAAAARAVSTSSAPLALTSTSVAWSVRLRPVVGDEHRAAGPGAVVSYFSLRYSREALV